MVLSDRNVVIIVFIYHPRDFCTIIAVRDNLMFQYIDSVPCFYLIAIQ